MSDKNQYALNDDDLDQVIGGVGGLYNRTPNTVTEVSTSGVSKGVLGTTGFGSSGITTEAEMMNKPAMP